MVKPTKSIFSQLSLLLISFALLCFLTACGDKAGSDTDTGTNTTITPTAASLNLSVSPTTVKSDNSTYTTITITALNALNAAVASVPVIMGADTGIVGASNITTGSDGTATVTFRSGGNPINRTATITATAGSTSQQIIVPIVGSTITLNSTGTTILDSGSPSVEMTVTVKNALGGAIVPNAAVTLAKTSGTGNVTITPASGVTDTNGEFKATVAGVSGGAGNVTLTATALGTTATISILVKHVDISSFAINQQTLCNPGCNVTATDNSPAAMGISDTLNIQVNAPSSINVTFATTIGTWDGTNTVVTRTVSSNTANATLQTSQAGIANVQVYDGSNSDTLAVSMTSKTPNRITLQATPTVVSKGGSTSTGISTLIAKVLDTNGYPVGNAPVSFSIVNPTGGGETVLPVVVSTTAIKTDSLNLGEARTLFTSGSLSSGQQGVQIRATVVGTDPLIATEEVGLDVKPSGNDASVVIGGTALSVAFSQATTLTKDTGQTMYVLPMSVLVADSNGNPAPADTSVSLSLWPIAWSTGSACNYDTDGVKKGTFFNEDIDENGNMDTGEDGTRTYYATGLLADDPGNPDGHLTPGNSWGGTVPPSVKTDATGVGNFILTYPISSSIWTIVRIRATTIVQGTETVGQVIFRLAPLASDVSPVCAITGSSYKF